MDEHGWLDLLRSGDSGALEHFLERYSGMMAYIVRGILQDPHEAEECLAQVRAKLWEKLPAYQGERASLSTWVTAICRNAAYDRLRERQRHASHCTVLGEDHPDPAPGPEEQVLLQERAQQLRQALEQLKEADRRLFYRKYYYLQSTAQIAAELGMTPRAVEGRLYRIRGKLQDRVGGDRTVKNEEFDRLLMDQAGQLPPLPADLEAYTPWRSAMTRLVWGMVLTTFHLQFFYLNYLLPLLGSVLIYLGCRILRRESGWFRLCGALGGLYLVVDAAFLVLYLLCLYWMARQGSALAGRGYQITPAPVRLPGWAVGAAVFGAVALCMPAALYLGSRIPNGPVEPVTAPLAGSQAQARDHLVELGLPEELANMLDEKELALCDGAVGVKQSGPVRTLKSGERPQTQEQHKPSIGLDGGQVSLEAWAVVLPGSRLRCYCAFYWDQLPEHRLQEQASLDLSGNYPAGDYAGRLLWERDGQTYTVLPDVQLAGGQGVQELTEDARWWYEEELERLGHLHYSPWFDYSIPRGAQQLRGYLAYTSDISSFEPGRTNGRYEIKFVDHSYLMIRHQSQLLQYPFHSISSLGGSRKVGAYGPIQSICGAFDFIGYPYPYE